MQINKSNLETFFLGLSSQYADIVLNAPVFAPKMATVVTSNTTVNRYALSQNLPTMRLWSGDKIVHTPGNLAFTLENQPFELTIAIDTHDLEDDNFGLYEAHFKSVSNQSAKVWDYQLRDLLWSQNAQAGKLGIDGVAHFAATHPVDFNDATKGTYCNDFRGGVSVDGVTVGGALSPNALATCWQHMASLKSESGEAMGIIPTLTVVPPQLDITAKYILQAQFFAPQTFGGATNVGSSENVMKGSTDLLMVPELAGKPTEWYMLDTSKSVKPFIVQVRKAPTLIYKNAPTDDSVFNSHTMQLSAEARGTVGFAQPFLSLISGS